MQLVFRGCSDEVKSIAIFLNYRQFTDKVHEEFSYCHIVRSCIHDKMISRDPIGLLNARCVVGFPPSGETLWITSVFLHVAVEEGQEVCLGDARLNTDNAILA